MGSSPGASCTSVLLLFRLFNIHIVGLYQFFYTFVLVGKEVILKTKIFFMNFVKIIESTTAKPKQNKTV